MFSRAPIVALILLFAGAGLMARAAAPDVCKGVFAVGPYLAAFFATQAHEEGTAQRYCREIPSFGPTHLYIEIAAREDDPTRPPQFEEIKDLDIEARLYWARNDLKTPELLKTYRAHGVASISFDYDFSEDGKYVVGVSIRKPDGAVHEGEYIFFVIAAAESGLVLAVVAALFLVGFAVLVWRLRKPLTPPAPPR
ncbi:hypothetical protein [Methylocystis sp. SC2]|uniref:hypothetical protein n=1 Tax=Methylocystis sp. (strain SC2) TaxID=187303 RepID=UPI00031E2797|nr:hypothetical protein [Methylocystis sp. SC2]